MREIKKVKVLFIARKFPPSVGGMERFAIDLYNALSKKADIRLIKWGGSNKYLPVVFPVFFIRACWVLLTSDVDIIHIQDGLQAPIGVALKFLFRKPLCVVIHGLDVTYENRLYQVIISKALKRADHIFCISNAAREQVVKRHVPEEKANIIPLGVTDDLFSNNRLVARKRVLERIQVQDKDIKIILSTGRLVKRKGINWFIQNVMPKLLKRDPHILFLISGDGEDKDRIQNTIDKKKLAVSVKLLGRTDNDFLRDLYNGSDIFVMPNITVKGDMEGFGRVLIEASLCELPLVATGIEGIKDAIIDGQNGILVKEKDSEAFVKHISDLMINSEKARDFGKNSRVFSLKQFNWQAIADQYLEVYRKLL